MEIEKLFSANKNILPDHYILITKDGWKFEGSYKRRRNGMRNYVICCIKPPKQPGMFVGERMVPRKYYKAYGFIMACKNFKKELESKYGSGS